MSVANSIVSGNTAPDGAEIYDFGSNLTAAHNNLFGHSSLTLATAFTNFTPGATDINATSEDDGTSSNVPTALSSILDKLDDNGCQQEAGAPPGATCVKTHALVTGSPAIGKADSNACPQKDQRGKKRDSGFFINIVTGNNAMAIVDLGDGCDIGAFEM